MGTCLRCQRRGRAAGTHPHEETTGPSHCSWRAICWSWCNWFTNRQTVARLAAEMCKEDFAVCVRENTPLMRCWDQSLSGLMPRESCCSVGIWWRIPLDTRERCGIDSLTGLNRNAAHGKKETGNDRPEGHRVARARVSQPNARSCDRSPVQSGRLLRLTDSVEVAQ